MKQACVEDKVDEEPVAATFANNAEELANANAFAANAFAANDKELDAIANAFANNDEVLADANAFAANDEELDANAFANNDEVLAAANALANNDEELDAAIALAATKDTHIVPKKNDVKREKPEEPAVESTTLEAPPSPPPKTVKNKPAKSKKIGVEFITIKNKPAESKKIGVEFITHKQV